MGMIDQQYKDQVIKDLRKELGALRGCFRDVCEMNVNLRKEIVKLDKLLELNMNDLWDIADQRDWYYEEYRKLKAK